MFPDTPMPTTSKEDGSSSDTPNLDSRVGKVCSGIICSAEIPLLDRAGYTAHIASLDPTTPVYQAAFGFWPCDVTQGSYYTSVEVVKPFHHERVHPHFTVNMHYHGPDGTRWPSFGACHVYLDNSISFVWNERRLPGDKRAKYFYITPDNTLYTWITPDMWSVISSWPPEVPKPPSTYIEPAFIRSDLTGDALKTFLDGQFASIAKYFDGNHETCTNVAKTVISKKVDNEVAGFMAELDSTAGFTTQPGSTSGADLPPPQQDKGQVPPVPSSPAQLTEQGGKRKRDDDDGVETGEPLQTRAKLEKDENEHIG